MKKPLALLVTAGVLIAPTWADDVPEVIPQAGPSGSAPTAGDVPEADLATQLANPLASLISVPIQANYDSGLGASGDGSRWLVNVQPVIPFNLTADWNLISRTIVPLIDQSGYSNSDLNESGIGDIVQSAWLSPSDPAGGWIWGVGAAFLLPTATDDALGGEKWGAGPTAVALKQSGHWTYGGLVNHIASFAGDSDRPYVNATFIQPFCSYITDSKTTFTINLESTYDWRSDQWNIPVHFMISQLLKIGEQPIQIFAGAHYWAESPHEDIDSWGLRFGATFLFPK